MEPRISRMQVLLAFKIVDVLEGRKTPSEGESVAALGAIDREAQRDDREPSPERRDELSKSFLALMAILSRYNRSVARGDDIPELMILVDELSREATQLDKSLGEHVKNFIEKSWRRNPPSKRALEWVGQQVIPRATHPDPRTDNIDAYCCNLNITEIKILSGAPLGIQYSYLSGIIHNLGDKTLSEVSICVSRFYPTDVVHRSKGCLRPGEQQRFWVPRFGNDVPRDAKASIVGIEFSTDGDDPEPSAPSNSGIRR